MPVILNGKAWYEKESDGFTLIFGKAFIIVRHLFNPFSLVLGFKLWNTGVDLYLLFFYVKIMRTSGGDLTSLDK